MKNTSFGDKYFRANKLQERVLIFSPFLFACIGSLICYLQVFGESNDFQGYWQYLNSMEATSNCLNEVSDSLIAFFAFFTLLTKFSILSLIILSNRFCDQSFIRCFLLSVMMYFSRFYPIHESTQIRISLGIGFLFLAVLELFRLQESINNEKTVVNKYASSSKIKALLHASFAVLAFVLSSLFHFSCVLAMPLFVISFYVRTRKNILAISILLFIFAKYFFVNYMVPVILATNPRYSEYLYGSGIVSVNPFSSQRILDITLACVGLRFFNSNNKRHIYLLSLWIFSIISFYSLLELPAIAFRFSEMLQVFGIVLVAMMRSKNELLFVVPWIIMTAFISIYSFSTGSFFS
jgi:hypothetical protein